MSSIANELDLESNKETINVRLRKERAGQGAYALVGVALFVDAETTHVEPMTYYNFGCLNKIAQILGAEAAARFMGANAVGIIAKTISK